MDTKQAAEIKNTEINIHAPALLAANHDALKVRGDCAGAVSAEGSFCENGDPCEIRTDHFAEDALASTCESLRVELVEKKKTIEILTAELSMVEVKYKDLQHAVLLACPKIQDGLNQLRALQ